MFLVVSFLFWFPHFIYVPILSPYLAFLGGEYTFIGIVLGSYGLMQLIFRLPTGIFSDLVKVRKPFIIAGMLISSLSCLIFSMTESLGWILLARVLAGIAAATWVTFTVLYSTYFSNKEVHRAMGSISFIVVLGQFMGMSISGYVVNEWGWRAPFWIGAVISVIGSIVAFFVFEPKEKIAKEPMKVRELVAVMREPSLLIISLLSILAHSIIFTTIFGFIPTYALHIGLRTNDISFIVLAFMIPHAIATLFIGKYVVPFFGEWKSLQIAFLLAAMGTIVTPLVEMKWLFLVVQGVNGFALGLIFPLLLGMSIESIAQEKRATAMGAYQALYAIGIFAGPFVAGIFNAKFGIDAGFYFAGSLGVVAVGVTIIQSRKETHEMITNVNKSM
jgi:predicted MFS family arabinose efflux permease